MAIETRKVDTRPTIVTAGLSGEFDGWLRAELGDVGIYAADSPDEALDVLTQVENPLLIVNHLLSGHSTIDVLSRVRTNGTLADVPVVYLLDPVLDSVIGRKLLEQMGVRHLFLHPVDRAEVAREIRSLIGLEKAPARANGSASTPASDTTPRGYPVPEPARAVIPEQLPTAVAGGTPASPRGYPAQSDHTFLLVVEDDQELADGISGEAVTRGVRVEVAPRPEAARAIIAEERPDIVLLDLAFPNATDSGLSLLKELNSLQPPIPVLVLTASDTFLDRVQVASLGGRGFLQKTLPPSEVLDAVTRLVQQLATRESRVMIVDDDLHTLDRLRVLLQPLDIRLTTVDDPLRFWDTLEQVTPDLLMIDLDMPRLSGIELCRVVRNDARWSALPVLFLTENADPETVRRVFAAGADDFVSKPIVEPELTTKIQNRLERTLLYRSMAEIDPVTGVTNRRKSTDTLRQFLRLAERHSQPLSLALLDVDLFKQINDRYGHGTGDAVLQQLGKLLMREFRSEDVVARWGGEEFLIGMYGMTRADGVQRLTDLLEQLRHESLPGPRGERIRITFSAGVAQFSEDGTDLQSLYRAADAALYRAKANGRDRVVPVGWHADAPDNAVQPTDVVLIYDDDVQGSLITQALEAKGYRTHWLRDGAAATLLLGGVNPTIQAPVAVLDADVPDIDGLGVIRRLARDGTLRTMRVIVIAAGSEETEVSRALELGAFDAIYKPYTLPVLMQRVRRAMEIL